MGRVPGQSVPVAWWAGCWTEVPWGLVGRVPGQTEGPWGLVGRCLTDRVSLGPNGQDAWAGRESLGPGGQSAGQTEGFWGLVGRVPEQAENSWAWWAGC